MPNGADEGDGGEPCERGAQGAVREAFETAAMLITFILLDKYLEAVAKGRTSAAISLAAAAADGAAAPRALQGH